MKRSFDESSPSVDMSVHSKVCLKYFQCVIVPNASVGGAVGVKEAVSAIYEDASVMINTLLHSNSFSACETLMETTQSHVASSATLLIRDLILLTSFICTNAHQFQVQQKATPSVTSAVRRNTASPISALIAIAPYWAVAALLSQSKTDPTASQKVKSALKLLLSSKTTARAHLEISDEIIQCASQLPAHWTKDPVTNLILSRLRRALRTHFKNILLFAVILSVSMHTELSSNLHKSSLALPQVAIDHLLSASDDNCIDVVRIVVNHAPQLALVTDTGSVGATPLAYAASYRSRPGVDADILEYKLALGLCKVLTDVAASSLAISDRLGMLPLHHAARKGHSAVVEFLSSQFEFTVPLKDASGKAALHHALISWRQLNQETILHLAAMDPRVLRESYSPSAFDPLDYAQRHCPENLLKSLREIFTAAFTPSSSPSSISPQERDNLKKYQISPSGNASTSTDPELSESEMSNDEDAQHENDSISSVEEDQQEREVPSSLQEVKSALKDHDLLQYADTLLMLQSAPPINLDDEEAGQGRSNKRQKVC